MRMPHATMQGRRPNTHVPHATAAKGQDPPRTSLIPDSLQLLQQQRASGQQPDAAMKKQAAQEEARARRRALSNLQLPSFDQTLRDADIAPITRRAARILQLNIGLYCNQACTHCHVESSPLMVQEMMSRATADRCLHLLAGALDTVTTLDITGGAPELNSQFKHLVTSARALGIEEIIDRCNLTVLMEPGQEDLADFLAQHRVRVVASLPCYSGDNVDKQRGRGVYDRSIQGLLALNAVGYGMPGTGLQLDLVYNPAGAFLAPNQTTLEDAYRRELREAHGIEFSSLLALNNLPIKRFADWLLARGELEAYMQLLVGAFNPASVAGVMCSDTVSVDWQGAVYDCDFNQQLGLGMTQTSKPTKLTVFDIENLQELTGLRVITDAHCYGCTAGAGSSCGGALSSS